MQHGGQLLQFQRGTRSKWDPADVCFQQVTFFGEMFAELIDQKGAKQSSLKRIGHQEHHPIALRFFSRESAGNNFAPPTLMTLYQSLAAQLIQRRSDSCPA